MRLWLFVVSVLGALSGMGWVASRAAQRNAEVIPTQAFLTATVSGLERTEATESVIDVEGQSFTRARRLQLTKPANETNATQLTIPNSTGVTEGDILVANLWLRGESASSDAASVEFLFEKATDPWTKSVTRGIAVPASWKHLSIAFQVSESYRPGEAMASLRLAFQPQTVELGGLSIENLGRSKTLEEAQTLALEQSPLGEVKVDLDFGTRRQTLLGMGGNFCQPRYGSSEAMDQVGSYVLDHLKVEHARIGLPLEKWAPEPGVTRDDAQARASLEAIQIMARRNIPVVVSVWEGPQWLLPGEGEGSRVLAREKYPACAEAIGKYLALAKSKYGCDVPYFSFNEPDYGVNFKFTPDEMIAFIKIAGPMWANMGVRTKFVVGDTAGGSKSVAYDTPILSDPGISQYLGPIAFHCWDALSATPDSYADIAAMGKRFNKPVWCLESGHDAQLWRAKDPWGSWDNAIRTAEAYVKTLNLTDASLVDYWTYEDNYPVASQSKEPYPVFHVLRQMQDVLRGNASVIRATSDNGDLLVLATADREHSTPAVLIVNTTGAGAILISGLPAGSYRVTTRNAEHASVALEQVVTVAGGRDFRLAVPVRSVTTMTKE